MRKSWYSRGGPIREHNTIPHILPTFAIFKLIWFSIWKPDWTTLIFYWKNLIFSFKICPDFLPYFDSKTETEKHSKNMDYKTRMSVLLLVSEATEVFWFMPACGIWKLEIFLNGLCKSGWMARLCQYPVLWRHFSVVDLLTKYIAKPSAQL
jgi:hypothetical protein